MNTQLKEFLLWGHSLEEYQLMFDLTEEDQNKKILDCASGYASFNAQMHQKSKRVVSCDKAYDLPMPELKEHIETGFQNMLAHVKKNKDQFMWQHHNESIATLEKKNNVMINQFFADFSLGKKEDRYVAATLPILPFDNNQFDLALCAYFLFSSSELTQQFHIDSIKEMCRVAGEVRIFPLIDIDGEPSLLLAPVILQLQQQNYGVEIKQVPYEFQQGTNAMLRVWIQTCEVS